MADSNKNIIDQFELLLKQITMDIDNSSGKKQMVNMYRFKSVKSALDVIKTIKNKIVSSDDLKNMEKIGKGTLARIDEILKTGKLSEVKITAFAMNTSVLLDQLEKVFGIGRKKAYELFMNYDIKSIDDLKKKYNSGEIELPNNIAIGLKYYDKIQEKIPREEIDEAYKIMSSVIASIDVNLFSAICGSYRRLSLTSGDIDMIIVHPHIITKDDASKSNYLYKIIKKLKEKKLIVASLTSDNVPTKYMGLFQLNKTKPLRRIDIRFIPYESYYYALLYFTGAKDFNRKMRRIASDLGYLLNEYGLYDEKGNMLHVNSEKEIFDLLGMEYLSPDKRK